VIRVIAARLGQQVRPTDVFGRYGGEEFAVLAPDADLEAGYTVAERLRQAVALHPVRTRAGSLTITVSIGIAELQAEHVTVGAVLADADRALYEAKQSGRNQTRCLSSPAVATGRAEPGPQTGRTQYHSE
jgi:diguanylate cyclase (GGDEF)-like protein